MIFYMQDINDMLVSLTLLNSFHKFRFDFIGTVETIESDFSFLKNKFKFPFDLPHIESTQPG